MVYRGGINPVGAPQNPHICAAPTAGYVKQKR